MSPKPAKQKLEKAETTEITSDSESMEETQTNRGEILSLLCGSQTVSLHADTSGFIQAINSM